MVQYLYPPHRPYAFMTSKRKILPLHSQHGIGGSKMRSCGWGMGRISDSCKEGDWHSSSIELGGAIRVSSLTFLRSVSRLISLQPFYRYVISSQPLWSSKWRTTGCDTLQSLRKCCHDSFHSKITETNVLLLLQFQAVITQHYVHLNVSRS